MAPSLSYSDYTIGWVSALPIELAAAQEMLDEEHDDLPQIANDNNIYSLGSIGEHNVVIACLPAGQTGIGAAATVAMQMKSTFGAIRFGLMVGIGGGVPSDDVDIRLGDIVVSQPGGGHGGVIQYDFGKTRPDKFERTGFLNAPPAYLLSAVAKLHAAHDRGRGKFYDHVSRITKLPRFSRENAGPDILYTGDDDVDGSKSCKEVEREVRAEEDSIIHYGTIASGNQVMRYGKERDAISKEFKGVLCFEMEAAGLMHSFPCLVIRGICDYADSFKHKKWQPYAAAVAAAYAKDLLSMIPQTAVVSSLTAAEALDKKPVANENFTFGSNDRGMQIGKSYAPINFSVAQAQAGVEVVINSVLGSVHVNNGVLTNSKAAASTDVTGQTQKSLRPVATYVARPSLYNQLKARLHDTLDARDPSSKIVVVCGLGGAGKSQLVLHYVQTHRQDYAAVFWIEAGSRTTLARDYIQIWRLLSRSSEEKISFDDAIRGVKAWLQGQQADKKWLLVFDSADNIDDEAHKDYIDLSAVMPDASCVDIIVTTRSQSAKDMTDIEEIQVGDLDKGEAQELLLRCSKIKNATVGQQQEARLIVKELGHFALAVALAGAYIAATPRIQSCLEKYLPQYRSQRKKLLGRRAQRQAHQYGESVLTTWETSYAAIASEYPDALGLLRLLAFLSADDIFYEIFDPLLGRSLKSAPIWSGGDDTAGDNDVVTQETLDSALEMLSKYSLLSWKEEQNSFAMHKLVHMWGYERTTVEEQSAHGEEALRFVGALLEWQAYDPAMRARLLPHLSTCFSRLQEEYGVMGQMSEKSLRPLNTGIDFLRDNGNFEQGVQFCELGVQASTRLYNDDTHEAVLAAEHMLALMYWHRGSFKEAERFNTSILARREAVLGEDHLDTLTSIANLALTYVSQGRYEQAGRLQARVLEICERVLGEEHFLTLKSMSNLALTYNHQGRHGKAAQLGLRTVEIMTRVVGEEHPDTLTSLANLVLVYSDQGLYEDAAEQGMKVMAASKKVLGAEHPNTLISMGNLALTYSSQGLYEQAEKLQVKVLELSKRVLGEEHLFTLTSMNNLAMTYSHQVQYEQAETLQMKVLNICITVLGEEHPHTLTSMGNLAMTYSSQGLYEQAKKLQVKVLGLNKRVLGEEHPLTLTSMNNLVLTYSRQGRYEAAAELQVKELEIVERVLGVEHPSTLTSMNNLASTYSRQGRYEAAAELGVKAVEIWQRVLGAEHPSTLTIMANLAVIRYHQDRLQEACEMMAQCLYARTRVLGAAHPDTSSSADWLQTMEEKYRAASSQEVEASIADLKNDDATA